MATSENYIGNCFR